ncbi:MAG: patatin-like phospholipase family protein [Deltaproteobacteria bacterium]|nr:patatin-like phospholipase family protein [Deltaproteobacteria bacterium]MBW2068320.1 patatin-like phospholipase family protein [Deltaproteobacteria bacterium]
MFKTGFVLSGGAARALAHLGVMERLEEAGMKPDMIVGTSMGAIIGGLYCYYRKASLVHERMKRFLESEIFQKGIVLVSDQAHATAEQSEGFFQRFITSFRRGIFYTRSVTRKNLVPYDYYETGIVELVPEVNIEDLKPRFAAVALDVATGEEIVFRSGSLRRAVMASAAIPGIFPPVEFGEFVLVDGGWIDNVPVIPAILMGAHFVVCSDASWSIPELWPNPSSAIEMSFRCSDITRILLTELKKQKADVIIKPKLHGIRWSDFHQIDYCYRAGWNAAEEKLLEAQKRRKARWLQCFGGLINRQRRHIKLKDPIFV